jgi:hypothetical protein
VKKCEHEYWSEVLWDDVRGAVQKSNPNFAAILDQLNSNKSLPILFKAKYLFGKEIILSGKFKPPCNCDACKALVGNLTRYAQLPLGFVMNNCIEALIQSRDQHKTNPLRILKPGDLFGVFEVIDKMHEYSTNPTWTLSAGARTIIPLWQFRNSHFRDAIRALLKSMDSVNRELLLPHNKAAADKLYEQFWPMLKTMVQQIDSSWMVDVLFLDANWDDLEIGHILRAYLFEAAWNQSRELREIGLSNFQQQTQAVSQIVRISHGESIGFTPWLKNGELGPFALLQEALFNELLLICKRKKNSLSLNLPLLLLPCTICKNAAEVGSRIAYFSINNKFIEGEVDQKYSQECRMIARDILRLKGKINYFNNFQIDFFTDDKAHIEGDNDVKALKSYKEKFFLKDFEEQLSIAKKIGWPSDLTPENVMTMKSEGFFTSFARMEYTK